MFCASSCKYCRCGDKAESRRKLWHQELFTAELETSADRVWTHYAVTFPPPWTPSSYFTSNLQEDECMSNVNTSSPGGWRENGGGWTRGSSVCKCITVFLWCWWNINSEKRCNATSFRPSFCLQHCHLSFQHSSPFCLPLSRLRLGESGSLVLQMKPKPGGFQSLGNLVGRYSLAHYCCVHNKSCHGERAG